MKRMEKQWHFVVEKIKWFNRNITHSNQLLNYFEGIGDEAGMKLVVFSSSCLEWLTWEGPWYPGRITLIPRELAIIAHQGMELKLLDCQQQETNRDVLKGGNWDDTTTLYLFLVSLTTLNQLLQQLSLHKDLLELELLTKSYFKQQVYPRTFSPPPLLLRHNQWWSWSWKRKIDRRLLSLAYVEQMMGWIQLE